MPFKKVIQDVIGDVFWLCCGIISLYLFYLVITNHKDDFIFYSLVIILVSVLIAGVFSSEEKHESIETFIGVLIFCCLIFYLLLPLVKQNYLFDYFSFLNHPLFLNHKLYLNAFIYICIARLITGVLRFFISEIGKLPFLNKRKIYLFISFVYFSFGILYVALSDVDVVSNFIHSSKRCSYFKDAIDYLELIEKSTPQKVRKVIIGIVGGLTPFYIGILIKTQEVKNQIQT